jgi:predicted transcriptional regulator of viral defense system
MSGEQMKENPEDIFRSCGGQLRMSEAVKYGISRYMLYSLLKKGVVEKISRGVFRLVDMPPMSNPDLVTVSLRIPYAVICLASALAFHNLTNQIPHRVFVAIPRKCRVPSLDYPPLSVHKFSSQTYTAGIEEHEIDGVTVRIYSPEKTLADCFKFRNKIGMDIVLEALKFYRTRNRFNQKDLLFFAGICRVEKVMFPYLEFSV